MHYVYVLKSEHEPEQNYVGYTEDLRTRVSDHDAGKSTHTSKYRPWGLVCYHAFMEKDRAVAFERYLKSGSGREFRRRHFGV